MFRKPAHVVAARVTVRHRARPSAIRTALPGILLVMFLAALDQTIMASALPSVAGDLKGLDRMPAIITSYLVAATAAMPLAGKLGDAFGRKRILQSALAIFILGAVLCGLARSVTALIAFRAVQGIGGGGLMISAQAIIGELVSPRERGRYLGIIGSAFIAAAVVGPLAGGVAVDHLTWRWIFYLHIPLGIAAFAVVSMTLHLAAPAHHEPIDYAGAALLCLAIVLVILLCGGAAGRETPFLALAAAASVAGWLLTARRAADPIIPLGLFRDRSFAIPTAISFLIGFAMFATVSFLPAFLQVGLGLSATASGGVLLVLVVGLLSTMTASGLLITWTGRYKAYPVAGTALAVPAAWLFSTLDSRSGIWAVLAATLGLGLGMGLVMQVMVLLVQNSVGRRELGTATSTLTLLRQVGAAIGVAVLGSLITARFVAAVPVEVASALGQGLNSLTPQLLAGLPAEDRAAVQEAFGEALPPVFAYAAIVLAAAFVLALFLPQRELRTVAFADDDGGGAPVRQRSGSASAGPKRHRKGRHRAQPARGRARDAAPDGRTA